MSEVRQKIEEIKSQENVRENLSSLREMLRQADPAERGLVVGCCMEADAVTLWETCLKHEDPKVRKNAALLIGDLRQMQPGTVPRANVLSEADAIPGDNLWQHMISELWQSYRDEKTLFVKTSYLKALQKFSADEMISYKEDMKEEIESVLEELRQEPLTEENAKHLRQERKALEGVLERFPKGKEKGHKITSPSNWKGPVRLLLVTDPAFMEPLAEAATPLCRQVKVLPMGVAVVTERPAEVLALRLYKEVWFMLRQKTGVMADWEHLPEALVSSELFPLLGKIAPGEGAYSFRIRFQGQTSRKLRGDDVSKMAFAMEEASHHRLHNGVSDYEIELLFVERKDHTFGMFVKMMQWKDRRFAYRKGVLPTSMHPVTAAAMMAQIMPYLKEDTQILDPFCGTGTLLIERARCRKAAYLYGTDTYGDAVRYGRENAKSAGCEIFFINRDYFDFTSEYFFDEILTEFPRFLPEEKEKVQTFYRKFFEKSAELTKEGSHLFLLSSEENEIKKQLRLSECFHLVRQIPFRKEESVFVIERR